MGTGSFPGVKSGRSVSLTPHPLLVPWLRKSSAIPLLPLWAVRSVQSLSACTRVHFTFYFCKFLDYEILVCHVSIDINLASTLVSSGGLPFLDFPTKLCINFLPYRCVIAIYSSSHILSYYVIVIFVLKGLYCSLNQQFNFLQPSVISSSQVHMIFPGPLKCAVGHASRVFQTICKTVSPKYWCVRLVALHVCVVYVTKYWSPAACLLRLHCLSASVRSNSTRLALMFGRDLDSNRGGTAPIMPAVLSPVDWMMLLKLPSIFAIPYHVTWHCITDSLKWCRQTNMKWEKQCDET